MKRTITPNESADEERRREQIRRNQAVIDLLKPGSRRIQRSSARRWSS